MERKRFERSVDTNLLLAKILKDFENGVREISYEDLSDVINRKVTGSSIQSVRNILRDHYGQNWQSKRGWGICYEGDAETVDGEHARMQRTVRNRLHKAKKVYKTVNIDKLNEPKQRDFIAKNAQINVLLHVNSVETTKKIQKQITEDPVQELAIRSVLKHLTEKENGDKQ